VGKAKRAHHLTAHERSTGKIAKREKGIWQRRYWEHAIRDDADFERHIDYIQSGEARIRYARGRLAA
jgi:putative transposase